MRSNATLFYAGIIMVFAGLILRFAWPSGGVGVALGYGITLVGIVLFVVVIRRGRASPE
jgi:hypothetical protein